MIYASLIHVSHISVCMPLQTKVTRCGINRWVVHGVKTNSLFQVGMLQSLDGLEECMSSLSFTLIFVSFISMT